MPAERLRSAAAAVLAAAGALATPGCGEAPGRAKATLVLTVVDAATGQPVPARVELLDSSGRGVVPSNAMPIRRPECFDTAIPAWLRGPRTAHGIDDLYSGTEQFYVDGRLETPLPADLYALRVFKGTEYRVASAQVGLHEGERAMLHVALDRFVDLPAEGWWGADDHLHIARAGPEDDAPLARWMAAEGLHVASLLQGGSATRFDITPQYAFGREGAYRAEGGTPWLIAGQEQPRTHLLGHALVLGGETSIDLQDPYLVYARFFREAARQGALAGYAHWALGAGGDGLAIDAPTGLVSFVEVLDFDHPGYAPWYDLLNLGLWVAPTAGTDYPCNPQTLPGRDRFYARVEGDLTPASWLAAVRAGRTFVTNGPTIEIDVAGTGPGGAVRLDAPGAVRVRGRVRFDPARDDVHALELVQAGVPVATVSAPSEPGTPGEIAFEREIVIEASTWLALRARGVKRGETAPPGPSTTTRFVAWLLPKLQGGAPFAERFMRSEAHWPSAAHTAAVNVTVAGTPPIALQPGAREVARRFGERLRALRARLEPERLGELPIWSVTTGDGVPLDVIERDRDALVAAIDEAMAFYARVEQRVEERLDPKGGPQ